MGHTIGCGTDMQATGVQLFWGGCRLLTVRIVDGPSSGAQRPICPAQSTEQWPLRRTCPGPIANIGRPGNIGRAQRDPRQDGSTASLAGPINSPERRKTGPTARASPFGLRNENDTLAHRHAVRHNGVVRLQRTSFRPPRTPAPVNLPTRRRRIFVC